ncbi:MAG: hypothetical protein M3R65_01370 [Gemmatimonadota bacterium]|nr:hypothetical protein [Gemmatimonadota bacterium]
MKSLRTHFRFAASAGVALTALLHVACGDGFTAPNRSGAQLAAESLNSPGASDAPETIFLAPLGPRKHPRGVLDTTLSPSVSICRLDGETCSADTLARFTFDSAATSRTGVKKDSATRVSLAERAYVLQWNLKAIPPNPNIAYRITVALGDTVAGFTDVKIVSEQYSPAPTDTAQFALVSARNVLTVRFQIFVPPVTLTVISEAGVHGDLNAQTYSVRRGDRVAYSFAADSGYQHVLVTVDQNPVPRRGRVLMDESHVLVASADRDASVLPGDEWILRDSRTLLRSRDKVRLARQLLSRLDELKDTANLAERLHRVELSVLQRPADANEMRALDDALTGQTLDAGSGVGSAGSAGAGGGGGGIATTMLVPMGRVAAPVVRPVASVSSPTGMQTEPVTIAYVNGILTTPLGALFAAHQVARIAHAARWDANVPFEVKLMYNRSAMADETSAEDRCILDIGIKGDWLGLNSLPGEVARCLDTTEPRALSMLADFLEVGSQFSNVLKRSISTRPKDVDSIAALTQNIRGSGQHVVFVMHSQGNMMVQQALSLLVLRGQYAQSRDTTCVGGVALAAPTSSAWPITARHLTGLVVNGDIILALGHNNFTRVRTPMSDSAAQVLSGSVLSKISGLASASAIRWGMRLHGAVDSYLTPPVMQDRVERAIVAAYRSCALGQVRVSPQTLELRTGDTGRLSATFVDLTGEPLDGKRGLAWRADSYSDWQRAVQLSADGVANARYVGGTSVTAVTRSVWAAAGVTVSPATLAVTVTEKLFAQWMTLFISTSEMVPIPTFEVPSVGWDGGPCTEKATFMSNGRTGTFSKQCMGEYNALADPFPGAGRYQASFFETGATASVFTVGNSDPSLHGTIGGPEPTLDLLPGPKPIDRVVMTAEDAAGHLLARGVACVRGCKGWPPDR